MNVVRLSDLQGAVSLDARASHMVGRAAGRRTLDARADPAWVRWLLMCVSVCFLGLFIVLPLINVFTQAFSKGVEAYVAALTDPDSLAAIRLTLLVAATSVALNVVFGLTAAWAITKFEFRGKSLLITLIDLPFSVSPVVAGLVFVLLFGLQGCLRPVACGA